jgi:hypothetical protein
VKKCVLLVILIALVAGCRGMHHGVAGSGNRHSEKRNVGACSSISTEGAFDIEVVCQKPQDVEIKGDDNVLPLITTEVSNNVLHIKSLRGYSVSEPITLKISVPDLIGIHSSGAGTIEISGLKNEKFDIDATGAPTIRASGETKTLKIDASGAGKVDTHRLRATDVEVDAKGVAGIEVYAREHLDVTVSGPSHVIYQGDAVVNKTVNGPGSVEKKESEVD